MQYVFYCVMAFQENLTERRLTLISLPRDYTRLPYVSVNILDKEPSWAYQ